MRVAAIVLTWRGWEDAIECLESVLRTDPAPAMVILCDNDSDDGSLDRIRDWAAGRLDVWLAPENRLRDLTIPPVQKPIPLDERGRDDVDQGDHEGGGSEDVRLIVVNTGGNIGYAAGNNVGIRHALARPDIDAVWILNNDTVVSRGALGELVRVMESTPGAGMCGSTLFYYDQPDIVQTLGGASYNSWLALPEHIGEGQPLSRAPSAEEALRRTDYVNGASMLVTRELIEEIGPMEESYFLYFEELDWALRAAGRYALAYAPASVVFHKEGRTIGTDGPERKSLMSDRLYLGNRIKITRRFFPRRMKTVRLALLLSVLQRARRRQWDRVHLALQILRGT